MCRKKAVQGPDPTLVFDPYTEQDPLFCESYCKHTYIFRYLTKKLFVMKTLKKSILVPNFKGYRFRIQPERI